MALERNLDSREILTLGDGESIELVYEGQLDEDKLTAAVELLGVKHPLLCARVRNDSRGQTQIYVPDGAKSELEIIPALEHNEDELKRSFIDRSWDPHNGVVKFGLIRGRKRGYVVMKIDHGVTDGHFIMLIIQDLWRTYTALVQGCAPLDMRPATSLPATFLETIEKHFSDWSFVGEYPKVDDMVIRWKPMIRRITLGYGDSLELQSVAHSTNTTVHGLLSGAVMVAQRDYVADCHADAPKGGVPMVCVSPVDLRSRADRPIGADDTDKLTAMHHATVLVKSGADPREVGREIAVSIRSALDKQELRFGLVNEHEIRASMPDAEIYADDYPEPILLYASVSNLGAVDKFGLPDGLKVHMQADFNAVYDAPCYGAWTVEGRLSLVGGFAKEVHSSETADGIMERIAKNLRSLGIPSASVSM